MLPQRSGIPNGGPAIGGHDPRVDEVGEHVAERLAASRRRRRSNGVSSAFRITRRAPVAQRDLGERRPRGTRRATCPTARNTSAPAAARCARSRSSGTRFSPNEIVADFRIPPHSRQAGSSSPARTRSSVSSIGPRQPHDRHFTSCTLPWISIDRSRATSPRPGAARRRSGSRACAASARRSSSASARWPAFGSPPHISLVDRFCHTCAAVLGVGDVVLERRRLLGAGFLVHTPCGPRKSGMPDSVEMPAPVSTTIWPRVAQPARRCGRAASSRHTVHGRAPARARDASGAPRGSRARRSVAAGGWRDRPELEVRSGSGGADGRWRGCVRRALRGGVRTPSARSRGTIAGGSRCACSTRSTWSASSPCSSSVNATRRALRRAVGERRARRGAPRPTPRARAWSSRGQPPHVARFTGGRLRRTATVPRTVVAREVELREPVERAHDR